MLKPNRSGFFPYTPATTCSTACAKRCECSMKKDSPNVFRRHERHGEATRAAVRAWGFEIVCEDPREYSNSLTAVFMPAGHDSDRFRSVVLDNFDMSLGAGLSKLAGKVFRIGHLGSFNDLMLAGTLCGVEMGLQLAGVPHKEGGVNAALHSLAPANRAAETAGPVG